MQNSSLRSEFVADDGTLLDFARVVTGCPAHALIDNVIVAQSHCRRRPGRQLNHTGDPQATGVRAL